MTRAAETRQTKNWKGARIPWTSVHFVASRRARCAGVYRLTVVGWLGTEPLGGGIGLNARIAPLAGGQGTMPQRDIGVYATICQDKFTSGSLDRFARRRNLQTR